MAKKMRTACTCLTEADKQLREKHGATFKQAITIDFDNQRAGVAGPFLEVEWVERVRTNRKLPVVDCAFCPFCGKEKP